MIDILMQRWMYTFLESYMTLPCFILQVNVGDKLNFEIGYLEYASSTNVGSFSKQLIIGLSVGAVVLILILVVCLIVYRQKSNQNSRVLKSMQEQMDVLELRVAAECKEGEDGPEVIVIPCQLYCAFFPP